MSNRKHTQNKYAKMGVKHRDKALSKLLEEKGQFEAALIGVRSDWPPDMPAAPQRPEPVEGQHVLSEAEGQPAKAAHDITRETQFTLPDNSACNGAYIIDALAELERVKKHLDETQRAYEGVIELGGQWADKARDLEKRNDELLAALRIDTTTLQVVLANDSKNIAAHCCIERNRKLIAKAERRAS